MDSQPKTTPKGVIILLLVALIWGSSFVAQSVGMENVQSFTFNGIRTLLGAFVILPYILIKDKITKKNMSKDEISFRKKQNARVLKYGIVLGVILCLATNFQQFAFNYSSAGKIAFITAMYMFFVPLIGLIFKKRVPLITWICVLLGFVGLFLLCIAPSSGKLTSSIKLNKGDILAFICAIFFALQILFIERFAPSFDAIKLSCVQFFTSGIITIILMFIFETPQLPAIKRALIPILYSGIMSCGLAYTFQIVGQKHCEATIASLLMCMESVFAVITSAIILHERLTFREGLGCVIMFCAIIISQLGGIKQKKL